MRTKYTLLIFLSLWALFASLGYVFVQITSDDDPRWQELASSGEVTYGVVTGKDPGNHASIAYKYRVGEKEYSGTGHAGGGNPPFEDIQIGQRLIIYVDPQDPSNSFLGDPKGLIAANERLNSRFILMFSIFPFVIIVPIYFVIRATMRRH